MKTSTKILIVTSLVAAVTVGGFFAYLAKAGTNDESGAAACRPFGHRWAALGLSSDQKAQIKVVLQKCEPTLQPLVQQLVTERRALRADVQAETVDEPAIRAEAAKVASLEADVAVQRAHIAHDIRALLTPDQIQKFKELQPARDARFDDARQRVAKRIMAD
jgi:protein CpxP